MTSGGLTGAEAHLALTETVARVQRYRDVIVASGPDTVRFLQSQFSQDVIALQAGESALSFHLAPQGKVIALVRLTRLAGDGVVIDTDVGAGQLVASALTRFKIRTKCDLTVGDAISVLSVRGPHSTVPATLRGETPNASAILAGAPLVVDVGWPDWPGFDVLVLGELLPVSPLLGQIPEVDESAYEAARIALGVPRFGQELDETTIPGETGLIPMAVNFTKGCYVGQELVERIDARGRVNRHLRGLDLDASTVPAVGATVRLVGDDGDAAGKQMGEITSATLHPVTGLGLAMGYVRREVPVDARVELRWADGSALATVRAFSSAE